MESANSHPAIVTDYLQAELNQNRVAGLFNTAILTAGLPADLGSYQKPPSDQWRLVVDFSYPKGHSVNDGISRSLCSLKNITIDDAIKQVSLLGPGTLMAKIDI